METLRRKLSPVIGPLVRKTSQALTGISFWLTYKYGLWFVYAARANDIFVVSYPKAGTTVLQMMLYQIFTDGSMNIPHIDAVAPWFESAVKQGPRFLDALASPRIFKSHRTIADLPRRARCIYIVRNPKDTCVSYYHHLTSLHGQNSAVPDFVQTFLYGKVPWGSWFRHARKCFSYIHHPRVLFVTYDEIVTDLPSLVDRVTGFLSMDLAPAKRQLIIERCGIEFMRKHNAKFDPRYVGLRMERTPFIRKGISGDWSNLLPPALARIIDSKASDTVRKFPGIASDDVTRFLGREQTVSQGAIYMPVDYSCGDRLLVDENDAVTGVYLARFRDTGLLQDQVVSLGLRLPDQAWIRIESAKVGAQDAAESSGTAFTFVSVKPDVVSRLQQFRMQLQHSLQPDAHESEADPISAV